MRSVFVTFLLFSFTLLVAAQGWEDFVVTTTGKGFFDEKSIKVSGTKRTVWRKFYLDQESSSGQKSSTTLVEIDCKLSTARYLYQITYNVEGVEKVRNTEPEPKAQPIVPYSVDDSLKDRVCDRKKR